MNTPPVSKSVRSAEFFGDSIGSTDVSLCPFTVLAKGIVPRPGIKVIVFLPGFDCGDEYSARVEEREERGVFR